MDDIEFTKDVLGVKLTDTQKDVMKSWQDKPGDPIADINAVRNLEPEFGPVNLLVTTTQATTMKAMELYTKWKEAWRKKHPILAFIEKVLDRIKNPKYHCKICGLTYKNPEGAKECYEDCLREY